MEERGGERKTEREREAESKGDREHNSLGGFLASLGLIIRALRRAVAQNNVLSSKWTGWRQWFSPADIFLSPPCSLIGIPSAFVHVSGSVDVERSSEEGEVGGESCSSSKNTEGMHGSEQAGEEGEVGAPRTMVPRCRRGAVSEMSLL